MMQLGVDGIFVGSGIFKSQRPDLMADAIVKATTHYQDPAMIAEVSKGLGEAMAGLDIRTMPESEQLATRGW
jgi:pyridoxal 5'-phosphate synthase pdxS subunit